MRTPDHRSARLRAATALFMMGEGCAERIASLSAMPQMEVERERSTCNDGSRERVTMERVRLGKSALQVSPVAFGTWWFGA